MFYYNSICERIHLVYLINVEQDLQNKFLESTCRLPSSTPTIAICYYLVQNLMLILSYRGR